MKGLELAKRYYEEYGEPMIKEKFPEYRSVIATGLVGSGSECYGYDDELSRDHDFEPGFCIFLPEESVVDSKTAFAMERAYAKLPREFMGYSRSRLSPVGGNRHGVIRAADFFISKTGTPDGRLTLGQWFSVPEQSLFEATGGAVFRDDSGFFEAVRQRIAYFPEDVRRKKLSGQLLLMAQSGQYNYERCVKRGELAAAQLSLFEFVKAAISCAFLIEKRYCPYYKWSFKALSELRDFAFAAKRLEYLITAPNTASEVLKKLAVIEELSSAFIAELHSLGMTRDNGSALEAHAYSVNDTVSDSNLRNLHILFAV